VSETGTWGRAAGRLAVVGAVLSGLAACGGGGGGGAGTDPVVSPPAVNLRLANVRSSDTTQTLFDDRSAFVRAVTITADVQGDLAQLNGQTLFILVEDSAQLFQPDVISNVSGATGNSITLLGRSADGRTGSYRGPLRVNVCLDAACTRPFLGSPIEVPYQIDVLPGIRVGDASPIQISTSFGRAPDVVTVPVSLPTGMQFFSAFAIAPPPATLNDRVAVTAVQGSSPAVQLQGLPLPVGSYALTLNVSGGLLVDGLGYSLSRDVPVIYTVAAEPGVFGVMTPSSLALRVGSALPGQELAGAEVQLLAADGRRYSQVSRIEYQPPGPGGNLDAGARAWLEFIVPFDGSNSATTRVQFLARACRAQASPSDPTACLATGRYDALVYFKTDTGTEYPTALPVSLAVDPATL
jgi:hypothetical protein